MTINKICSIIELKKNNYPSYKNYYKVSNSEVKYSLNIKNELHHNALLYLLKLIFDFDGFYSNQEEIIIKCLNKGSVMGLLPTGAGKSLCYQLTSFLLPGTTLVISPLTVLMEDQVANMNDRHNISNIVCINHNNRENIDLFYNNQSKMVLVSPERFFNEKFINILNMKNIMINFVVVDEVHCISEWGHDFRTSYLCLNHYFKLNLNPKAKLMGLTATASTRVCQDILAEFQTFKKSTSLIQANTLKRENLNLYVNCIEPGKKFEYIQNFFVKEKEKNTLSKSVVFTTTKKSTIKSMGCIELAEKIGAVLEDKESISYFAGGEDSNYQANIAKLNDFKNEKIKVLFATKAFGMGVDIPDIRNTIHYSLPASIESLYQEFGRAGRDGKESNCYINYYPEDKSLFDEVFNYKGRKRIDSIDSIKGKFKEFETILYFLTTSHLDIEREVKLINLVYKFLLAKSQSDELVSFSLYEISEYLNAPIDSILIEKVLYRLYLLDLINIWEIVYGVSLNNPVYSKIVVKKVNVIKQIKAVNAYIRKYKANYEYKGEEKFDSVLLELLTWIYDNFVYHKIQSIKNVYELCQNYKDSKQFMKSIVDYLVIDTNIDKLAKDYDDYLYWFQILGTYNSSELKMILARYLEVDDTIVSLNYVSGLLRLQLNEFDDNDGKRRLLMALEDIKDYKDSAIDDILSMSLEYLSEENKDLFIEAIMEWDEEYAYRLHKYIDNDLITSKLILDFSNKLVKIGGTIYDKFRKDG